ncbi:hypothetical protein [Pseudomonas sp. LBUM920]|uniref:hypothetical protein n=1 Tax=Pseudomonas sp. LBUM920 TaxID=2126069 RepID=UPI000F57AC89|nr:hypothetical protein [Pseudomonas sp. LBUM920]
MLKAMLGTTCLLLTFMSTSSADVSQVRELAIVKAVDAPVFRKAREEDAPGCMTTRYTFGDEIIAMKLEFKCDRINVAWNTSMEPQNSLRSRHASHLAQRAVVALTQGNGIEVERVMDGGKYKGRTYSNNLLLSGSCFTNMCLLTFN